MRPINPRDMLVPAHAYSHGVAVGNLVFVAGQVALDGDGNLVGEGDPAVQTRQVLANVETILQEAGGSLSDVTYTTAYLKDLSDFDAFNRVYAEVFGDHRPARATVRAELVLPDYLVEVQAIAVISSD
jgi:reactive intermediate/imine deaminase